VIAPVRAIVAAPTAVVAAVGALYRVAVVPLLRLLGLPTGTIRSTTLLALLAIFARLPLEALTLLPRLPLLARGTVVLLRPGRNLPRWCQRGGRLRHIRRLGCRHQPRVAEHLPIRDDVRSRWLTILARGRRGSRN